MVSRTRRELTGEEINRIANTYHSWQKGEDVDGYENIPGYCRSASLEEVRKHGYVLTSGRYVGLEPQEEDTKPFGDKMERLIVEFRKQQAEGTRLDVAINENLESLGFGGWG